MAAKTSIEWTDATWNPIRAHLKEDFIIQTGRVIPAGKWGYHCERISPGCKNCYAATMNGRTLPAWGTGLDYIVPNREKVEIFLDEEELLKPLKWKRPRSVFVCSMTDLFADFVPDEFIHKIWAVMSQSPDHVFQVLTKRPERMHHLVSDRDLDDQVDGAGEGFGWCHANAAGRLPLPNVWLGVSVENQKYADERIPWLLQTPAAVRWISAEPLLGPVDLHRGGFSLISPVKSPTGKQWPGLDWVVTGAESGHGARPCDESWIRSLKDQCAAAAVPFFYKQKVVNGKKIGTPELDGRKWTEMPR